MIRPDDPQDKELAALYRAAAGEQPPAGLDARILAAAREAATPPREGIGAPRAGAWLKRWRIPVALAATVLMTSTLTLMVRDNAVDDLSPVAPVPRIEARKTDAAPPAPATISAPAAARESAATARPSPQPATGAPERTPANDGLAARRMERAATPVGATGNLESAVKDEPRPSVAAKSAGPTAGATAAAPAAALSDPAAARADSAASAESAARSAQSERAGESPERWLAGIRALRQQGRIAEAEESLAQFRKRYPQFPLPEDMRQP